MPEITEAQFREYQSYLTYGTPDEVKSKVAQVDSLKEENGTRRKENKTLKDENDALKAKVPDGAVVLTGEDAKTYEAATTAHGGLAGLAKKAERTEELEKEHAKRTREDGLGDAVESEGWDRKIGVKALTRDAEFAGLPFEVKDVEREVEVGGKKEKHTVRHGFVTVDGKQIPLAEWVQKNADHIIPSLTAKTQESGGREYVEQRGRSAPDTKAGDAKARAKAQNQEAASRPNALRPASNTA
jgi:regulator of replication initiation timing